MFTFPTTVVNKQERVREIRPQPRQEQFLSSPADIVIYGGAAGGGKTWALLMEGVRHHKVKGFGCTIFRRSYPEITMEGGLAEKAGEIYPHTGGVSLDNNLNWRWSSGARVDLRHLSDDNTLADYLGAQIALIMFDQLETFTEKQWWYMLSRNRTDCGVRPYIRATVNPDPDSFVRKLIDWWINPDTGYAIPERSGQVRWFVRQQNVMYWADDPAELAKSFPTVQPLSLTFILATLKDNPALLKADPGYKARLQAMDWIDQQRLLGDDVLGGNWNVRAEAGKVFNRSWFTFVDVAPRGGAEGRGWDLAGTLKDVAGADPDYCDSCYMRIPGDGYVYILDATHDRLTPGEVQQVMKSYADQDAEDWPGADQRTVWEEEPGSASKRDSVATVRLLSGRWAYGIPSIKNKLTRWKPLAAQATHGNVRLVRGSWNDWWLTQMHGQPDLPHDDTPDAASVIYNALVRGDTNPNQPGQRPVGRNRQSPYAEVFNGKRRR